MVFYVCEVIEGASIEEIEAQNFLEAALNFGEAKQEGYKGKSVYSLYVFDRPEEDPEVNVELIYIIDEGDGFKRLGGSSL